MAISYTIHSEILKSAYQDPQQVVADWNAMLPAQYSQSTFQINYLENAIPLLAGSTRKKEK